MKLLLIAQVLLRKDWKKRLGHEEKGDDQEKISLLNIGDGTPTSHQADHCYEDDEAAEQPTKDTDAR